MEQRKLEKKADDLLAEKLISVVVMFIFFLSNLFLIIYLSEWFEDFISFHLTQWLIYQFDKFSSYIILMAFVLIIHNT